MGKNFNKLVVEDKIEFYENKKYVTRIIKKITNWGNVLSFEFKNEDYKLSLFCDFNKDFIYSNRTSISTSMDRLLLECEN